MFESIRVNIREGRYKESKRSDFVFTKDVALYLVENIVGVTYSEGVSMVKHILSNTKVTEEQDYFTVLDSLRTYLQCEKDLNREIEGNMSSTRYVLETLLEKNLKHDDMCYVSISNKTSVCDIVSVDESFLRYECGLDCKCDEGLYIDLLEKYSKRLINLLNTRDTLERQMFEVRHSHGSLIQDMKEIYTEGKAVLFAVIKAIRDEHGMDERYEGDFKSCQLKNYCHIPQESVETWDSIEALILNPKYSYECLVCLLDRIHISTYI